jgi:hypothetical protein
VFEAQHLGVFADAGEMLGGQPDLRIFEVGYDPHPSVRS